MSSGDNVLVFRSLWRLILSKLGKFSDSSDNVVYDESGGLYRDLFSSTFGKAVEIAPADELRDLVKLLQNDNVQKAVASSQIQRNALTLLSCVFGQSDRDITAKAAEAYVSSLFVPAKESAESTDPSVLISNLLSGEVNTVLNRLVPAEVIDATFVRLIESVGVEIFSQQEGETLKKLLQTCSVLTKNVIDPMAQFVADVTEWGHKSSASSKSLLDLELTLSALSQTRRIGTLFKHLPADPAKERFLYVLATALTAATDFEESTAVRKIFFFVPKLNIDVMDKFRAGEMRKYNERLLMVTKEYLGFHGQDGMDEIRSVLRSAWTPLTVEQSIEFPFGGYMDEHLGKFLEDISVTPGSTFHYLPLGASAETMREIFALFPSYFEVVGESVSLTSMGARIVGFEKNSVKRKIGDSVTAADLQSEQVEESEPTALDNAVPTAPMVDDLRDILLREILQKLPQNAFLHRAYPSKVQPGVYRFGTRQVTFHVKGGTLFVYRVGDFVSESDAVEFVSREYGVAVDKLKSSAGMLAVKSAVRRPLDWSNQRLLFRIIRRGIRANDGFWREQWIRQGGPGNVKLASLEFLVKFLEQNIAHAAKQQWAADLLYEGPGPSSVPSDDDEPTIVVGSVLSSSGSRIPLPSNPADHPNYKTRLCVMFQQGRCTRGAACGYAHGESDLRGGGVMGSNTAIGPGGQPFYKTRMCNAFLEGRCSRGVACSYAHSEAERVGVSTGVVRRDVKATQDLRLAAKMEVVQGSKSNRERSRSRDSSRRGLAQVSAASKNLPFIPPPRQNAGAKSSRINESDL